MKRSAGRITVALVLLSFAVALVGGAHYYVARRLVLDAGHGQPLEGVLLAAIGLLFVSMFAFPIVERRLHLPWLRILSWPPAIWMGVLFLSVNVLALFDTLGWLMGAAAPADGSMDFAGFRAAGAGLLVALLTFFGLRGGLAPPAVKRVEIELPGWPEALDGFRIVQISDIHIGPLLGKAFARDVTERVNALSPDLVAVTGDLVDGSVAQLHDQVEPFGGLHGRHGVFFVTGNHDCYSGDEAWVVRARELGFRPLRNERVRIEQDGAAFELAGVDDYRGDWSRGSTEDLPRALDGRAPALPLVLLAHDPSSFKQARRAGVDLQLSGHTHGGQIFPFRFMVRLATPWVAGLYESEGSRIYVSRGTGFWGPPLRLLAPSEITEIRLRAPRRGATPA